MYEESELDKPMGCLSLPYWPQIVYLKGGFLGMKSRKEENEQNSLLYLHSFTDDPANMDYMFLSHLYPFLTAANSMVPSIFISLVSTSWTCLSKHFLTPFS